MKILLFGKNGQVGNALVPRLTALGQVIALGRDDVDLANADRIAAAIAQHSPQVIINAAAYTAVDRAESEEKLAHAINGVAPGVMARAAQEAGSLLVHYSTDYVFDGTAGEPYTEQSTTAPQSAYGRSKLAGEQAVTAAGGSSLVFRTAWVYSLHGHNFLKTMLRLAGERDRLGIVDDQVGSPTFAGSIADATVSVLQVVLQHPTPQRFAGIYHMTCGGRTSWCGFARRIFQLTGNDRIKVDAITTDQYPTPARRPAFSVLSNRRLLDSFGVELPHWEQALTTCLAASATVQ